MSQFFTSDGKLWSFSFSISPSNEYSGLISFKMDWLDLFVVQGTLKSLLQHHSSKAPFIDCIINNMYFHSVGCLFLLLMVSLGLQKLLSLTRYCSLFFLVYCCLFVFPLKKQIQKTVPRFITKSVVAMFCARSFMVSGLTCRS